MAGKFGPFVIGGLLGAAVALLYTPRTGEEMRAVVADKANEAWGQAQQAGATASERSANFYGEAQARGQAAYSAATDRAQQAYSVATDRAQQAYSAASNVAGQAFETAQGVFNQAADRVQEMRGGAAPAAGGNDELREKIEAARARIASQVAASADASQQAAEAQISVEPAEAAGDESAQ